MLVFVPVGAAVQVEAAGQVFGPVVAAVQVEVAVQVFEPFAAVERFFEPSGAVALVAGYFFVWL